MKINRLILGSSSRFRSALLSSTGLTFSVVKPDVDEGLILADTARDLALARAKAKGEAVAKEGEDEALVIGADQVLGFHDQAFDKVATRDDAYARLKQFGGAIHYLHSAFCLWVGSQNGTPKLLAEKVVDVPMVMRELSDAELKAYLDLGEWRDSVGCYQFENRGVHLFERVDDDSSAIIGLPLVPLLDVLRRLGINGLTHPSGPWIISLP